MPSSGLGRNAIPFSEKNELVVLNNFQTNDIIVTGKVHIFVPKYCFAIQFYTKGIILGRFKHEMEIGQNQSVI